MMKWKIQHLFAAGFWIIIFSFHYTHQSFETDLYVFSLYYFFICFSYKFNECKRRWIVHQPKRSKIGEIEKNNKTKRKCASFIVICTHLKFSWLKNVHNFLEILFDVRELWGICFDFILNVMIFWGFK